MHSENQVLLHWWDSNEELTYKASQEELQKDVDVLNKGQTMSCSLKDVDYMSFQIKFHVGNYTSQSSKILQEPAFLPIFVANIFSRSVLQSTKLFCAPPQVVSYRYWLFL